MHEELRVFFVTCNGSIVEVPRDVFNGIGSRHQVTHCLNGQTKQKKTDGPSKDKTRKERANDSASKTSRRKQRGQREREEKDPLLLSHEDHRYTCARVYTQPSTERERAKEERTCERERRAKDPEWEKYT